MIDTDTLIKRWAAWRIGAEPEQVRSVRFDKDGGSPGWSEWTPGTDPYDDCYVVLTDDSTHYIDLSDTEFPVLLREVLSLDTEATP